MAEFTPITSQEALDAILAQRLERERNKVRGEFADYDTIKEQCSTLQSQLDAERQKAAGYESQIGELNSRIHGYETDSVKTRVAIEIGLPIEMRSRLTGETEEEIRADAEDLVKLIGTSRGVAPMYNPEQPKDKATDAMRGLLASLESQV